MTNEPDNTRINISSINPLQPQLPGSEVNTRIGILANQAAANYRFQDYHQRRSENTVRRQYADLSLFSKFLQSQLNVTTGSLPEDPMAWQIMTWGLVEAFVKWQLLEGYAVSTVNIRLSTIKTYARLAMQAGTLSTNEYAMIKAIQGYSYKEQYRIDQRRSVQRLGLKKASPVQITLDQARLLKTQPNSPQGRRDTLMMCLLIDHGLRVGELAIICVENIDISTGMLHFYRPKVNRQQIHKLSTDSLRAIEIYANYGDLPDQGPLLRKSIKDGSLSSAGMSERAITQRVNFLGVEVGLSGLSAHDCRHYWATNAARHGTDPFTLQEAGGWSSLAMPRRYVEQNNVSNEKVKLE
jgi:integrase